MFRIIELIAIVAFVGAVMGGLYAAWEGFKEWIYEPEVAAQKAADQKYVDEAAANQKAAELERENAKTDTLNCQAIAKKQGDAVELWKGVADGNAKAAQQAKAKAKSDAEAAAPKIAELQAAAAAKPKLMACEEELGKAKPMLRDLLLQRRQAPVPPSVPAAPVK